MKKQPERNPFRKWIRVGVALIIGLAVLRFVSRDREQSGRFQVFGHVTLDGKDLPAGQISFTPTAETKGPATGGRITSGKFRIPSNIGPALGEYEVRITTGEPGPPGGGNRSNAKSPPEPRVSYFFTRTLTKSTMKQDFVLTEESMRKRPPH